MNTSFRIKRSGAWILVCLPIMFLASVGAGQNGCPALAPPDRDIYLIPNRVLQSYDFSQNGIAFIHDYGQARLAHVASTDGIPPNLQSQLMPLNDPSSIAFRGFSRQFATPAFVNAASYKEGVYLLAMFGPLASGILDSLKASGLIILENAPPYGLLVKADTESLGRAVKLCTTEGYRLIREIFLLPVETRLSPVAPI